MSTVPPPGGPGAPGAPITPGYTRYWGYYNRPYPGCGCLITILFIALLWWLLSLLFPPVAVWRRPVPPPAPPAAPGAPPAAVQFYDPVALTVTIA